MSPACACSCNALGVGGSLRDGWLRDFCERCEHAYYQEWRATSNDWAAHREVFECLVRDVGYVNSLKANMCHEFNGDLSSLIK